MTCRELTDFLGDYLGETGLVDNQGWIAQKSNWAVLEATHRL